MLVGQSQKTKHNAIPYIKREIRVEERNYRTTSSVRNYRVNVPKLHGAGKLTDLTNQCGSDSINCPSGVGRNWDSSACTEIFITWYKNLSLSISISECPRTHTGVYIKSDTCQESVSAMWGCVIAEAGAWRRPTVYFTWWSDKTDPPERTWSISSNFWNKSLWINGEVDITNWKKYSNSLLET